MSIWGSIFGSSLGSSSLGSSSLGSSSLGGSSISSGSLGGSITTGVLGGSLLSNGGLGTTGTMNSAGIFQQQGFQQVLYGARVDLIEPKTLLTDLLVPDPELLAFDDSPEWEGDASWE